MIFSNLLGNQTETKEKRKKKKPHLPQKLPRHKRSNLDDKTGEDIIRIMNMRVLLDYERIPTLIADHVKGFPFSDHVNLIASCAAGQPLPSDDLTFKR